MAAPQVFVMPSRLEPFGIVVLEAWRAGVAVVATDRGGPPEFVRDGADGLLVDPFDTGRGGRRPSAGPVRRRSGAGRRRRPGSESGSVRVAAGSPGSTADVYAAACHRRPPARTGWRREAAAPSGTLRVGMDLVSVAEVAASSPGSATAMSPASSHRTRSPRAARPAASRRPGVRTSVESLAARFAAKEAVMKVLETYRCATRLA